MMQAMHTGAKKTSVPDASATAGGASPSAQSQGGGVSTLQDAASDFLASALTRLLGSCPFTLPGGRCRQKLPPYLVIPVSLLTANKQHDLMRPPCDPHGTFPM